MKHIALISLLVLFLGSVSAQTTGTAKTSLDVWAASEPPALTIIYPKPLPPTNPPFIHWQKGPGVHHYRISLAGPSYEWSAETPWNYHTPEKPLPMGAATLRVESRDASGALLGRSVEHVVTLSTPTASLGGSLNQITAVPGALFYPTKDQLREIAESKDPERAAFRDGLLKHASSELPDILKDLREPPFYPDSGWDITVWNLKNNTCFALRDVLLTRSMAFRISGDSRYLESMRPLLMEAARWDPRGSTGLWESDHAAQSLLYSISVSLSLLREHLTPEEIDIIEDSVRQRAADLYAFHNPFVPKILSQGLMNVPENNHAWFTASALGFAGIALMGRAPEASDWLSFVTQLYHGVFLPLGGSSGEWHEGIDYWSYTLYFVFQFADALRESTQIDLYRHPWLAGTAFFKIYTHPADGAFVPFGDCKNHVPNHFDKLVMTRLASRYNDPLAWAWVDAISSEIRGGYFFDVLMWHERKADMASVPVDGYPYAKHFPDIGWVVVNSDPLDSEKRILLAFRCGPVIGNGAHSHADQNHFILNAGGDGLIVDAGYYDGYFTPHHKGYSSTSRAHNVVLVNGEGQKAFTSGTDARLVRFEPDGKHVSMTGDISNPSVYDGLMKSWVRHLDWRDEKTLVVSDFVMPSKSSRLSWLLQSDFPIRFDPESGELIIRGRRYELRGRFISEHPLRASITTGFPIPTAKPMPEQHHLEIATTGDVESWSPRFEANLSLIPDAAPAP